MLVGIVQVDDVQVLASSVVVKERHGSKHVEDAEPFCMEAVSYTHLTLPTICSV